MKINKGRKVLPFVLASSMIFSNLVPVFADTQEVEIKGKIIASTIDISINSGSTGSDGATYTIDPNASDGNYLTSKEITIINNSNFPINLAVADARNTTNNLTDVLPSYVGDESAWHNLGQLESESEIALGLKHTDGEYLKKSETDDIIYFKAIQNKKLTSETINLGAVGSKGSISYKVDGYHGLAFSKEISETYKIVFDVSLYQGNGSPPSAGIR